VCQVNGSESSLLSVTSCHDTLRSQQSRFAQRHSHPGAGGDEVMANEETLQTTSSSLRTRRRAEGSASGHPAQHRHRMSNQLARGQHRTFNRPARRRVSANMHSPQRQLTRRRGAQIDQSQNSVTQIDQSHRGNLPMVCLCIYYR